MKGADIKTSLRLAPINLPDAQLSLRFTWQDSETIDPFTGETRRLRGDFGDNYEIGYRQDMTGIGPSYGFTRTKVGQATILNDLMAREYFRAESHRLAGGQDAASLHGERHGGRAAPL